MKIQITDGVQPGKIETLRLIDPIHKFEYTVHYMIKAGAFHDGAVTFDKEKNIYLMSTLDFEWWAELIKAQTVLNEWLLKNGKRIDDAVQYATASARV